MAEIDTSQMSPAEIQQAIAEAEQSQWGKWRAKGPIFIDGVLAFLRGHDVPVHHVEKFDLQDMVEPFDQGDEGDLSATEPDPVPVAPQGQDIEIEAQPAKAPRAKAKAE